jgi:hypothetical protein
MVRKIEVKIIGTTLVFGRILGDVPEINRLSLDFVARSKNDQTALCLEILL